MATATTERETVSGKAQTYRILSNEEAQAISDRLIEENREAYTELASR